MHMVSQMEIEDDRRYLSDVILRDIYDRSTLGESGNKKTPLFLLLILLYKGAQYMDLSFLLITI